MPENKESPTQHDDFFDVPAVWAVEPPPARSLDRPAPDTLAQWCAGMKQLREPIGLELYLGESWSMEIRVAASTWLSGQTTGPSSRGVFVALRAVSGLVAPIGTDLPSADPVDIPLFDALAHSLRVNSRVVVSAHSRRIPGSVSQRGEDYLALHTTEKLSGGQQLRVVPLAAIDYISFLEPGDSF